MRSLIGYLLDGLNSFGNSLVDVLLSGFVHLRSFLTKGRATMGRLMSFFGGLRIRALNPLMAGVLVFAIFVGMVGHVHAQTSRYTLDDVMDKVIEMDKRLSHMMDKVIEMDKRLSVVETEVKRNRELIETVNTNLTKQIETLNTSLGARISDTNTTMFWLFGFLGTLFLGILALTFATYKNTASLVKPTEVKPTEVKPTDRSVPKESGVLEALRREVSALTERQSELEGKLKLAEVS